MCNLKRLSYKNKKEPLSGQKEKIMIKNLKHYEKIDELAEMMMAEIQSLDDFENESKQLKDLADALARMAGHHDYKTMMFWQETIAEVLKMEV